ncbi:MAG: hypothetical protein E7Z63_00990 [Thermoplasmata archaeon]|nr:hypothetical protein [Thermoplasmata archaeon]
MIEFRYKVKSPSPVRPYYTFHYTPSGQRVDQALHYGEYREVKDLATKKAKEKKRDVEIRLNWNDGSFHFRRIEVIKYRGR